MVADLTPRGALTDREKIWKAIRELQFFDVRDLSLKSKVDRRTPKIKEYLDSLTRAGILVKTSPVAAGCFARFELVRDMGVDAPRVRKDGSFVPVDGQTRMWRAMKILQTFSVRDLVVHVSIPGGEVAETTAARYCWWLALGGYICPVNSDVPRWRFVRDTGAKAPQILRVKQLFDPNIGEVVTGENVLDVLERDRGCA